MEKYEKALDIRQKNLGRNSAKAAESYYFMGITMANQHLHTEAIQYFQEAIDIQKSSRGANSKEVANSQDRLGASQLQLGLVHDAHGSLWEAMRIRRKTNDRRGIAESYCSIGTLHFNKQENKDALASFTLGLQIALEVGDEDLALQAAAGAVQPSKIVNGEQTEKTAILFQQYGALPLVLINTKVFC